MSAPNNFAEGDSGVPPNADPSAQPQPAQPDVVSSWPPPPPYYRLYAPPPLPPSSSSSSSSSSGVAISPSFSSSSPSVRSSSPNSSSRDQTWYEPPPPPPPLPADTTYRMFGTVLSTKELRPSLRDQGREPLYLNHQQVSLSQDPETGSVLDDSAEPHPAQARAYLKRLNHSLMFGFLQLVDTLTRDPTRFQGRVEDLELIAVNMHHLLNAYRPHQAREILVDTLREQIQRRKDIISDFETTKASVQATLETAVKQTRKGATSGGDIERMIAETRQALEEEALLANESRRSTSTQRSPADISTEGASVRSTDDEALVALATEILRGGQGEVPSVFQ
mmetsp:Transcript_15594/g.39868  ORF Transcript_15594/g.39868 Transcript_15594/m.39868 type:complete len:336 (-) Transcript_15594:701-1708(-)